MSKKNDLIAATKELLWTGGYESMSPKLILEKSGAGQGSLYHHFSGKEALALTALEEVKHDLCQQADSILLGDGSPMARINEFLSIERAATRGCRMGRLVPESEVVESSLLTPIQRYFRHLDSVLEDVLLQAREEGEIPDNANIRQLVYVIMAAIQGGYVLARALRDEAGMTSTLDGVISLLALLQQQSTHE